MPSALFCPISLQNLVSVQWDLSQLGTHSFEAKKLSQPPALGGNCFLDLCFTKWLRCAEGKTTSWKQTPTNMVVFEYQPLRKESMRGGGGRLTILEPQVSQLVNFAQRASQHFPAGKSRMKKLPWTRVAAPYLARPTKNKTERSSNCLKNAVIRSTAPVSRSDWPIACFPETVMHGHFFFFYSLQFIVLEMTLAFLRSKATDYPMRQLKESSAS